MPLYDKQRLISWLYQEFTEISVWSSQHPQYSSRCSYKKKKKRGYSFFLPGFRSSLLPPLPWSFASYLDTLFLSSPVRLKIQIHRYWSLFQIFPKIQTETPSTWLCSLQASNNSPWVPRIPDSMNSSQSPVQWLRPGLREAEIKQLSN